MDYTVAVSHHLYQDGYSFKSIIFLFAIKSCHFCLLAIIGKPPH